MKMESTRVAYPDTEFTQFMRTSSDPNRAAVQRIRSNKLLSNTRTLSISPEIRKVDDPKSPQLNKLRRADSYRIKAKQKPTITTSTLESRKKKKERRRVRSQSSPMFPPNLDVTDPNLGKTIDEFTIEPIKEDVPVPCEPHNITYDAEYKKCPLGGRKKSFVVLKDLNLKKIIENTRPILKRSQSQRFMQKPVITKVKYPATDDDDSDDGPKKQTGGPLFQATTLFVPGYDFKSKQSTLPNMTTRKSSTPQLPRRSSKERMSIFFDKVITRQSSTPCLLKRDSKEKMKKIELLIEEKIIETPTLEDDPPIIALNNRANETTPPEQLNDDFTDVANINQRKASIALKQKLFRDKGTKNASDNPTISLPNKVKQLACGYDDGTAYVKVGNLVNKTSDLSLKYNSVTSEFDTSLKDRCKYTDVDTIFEKPDDGDNRASRSYTGTESGYASLTESFNLEKDTFANSWSQNEWAHNDEDPFGIFTLPTPRVFSRDLCVTEL